MSAPGRLGTMSVPAPGPGGPPPDFSPPPRRRSERLLSACVYFVVGVLVGTVGTFTHRARVEVFEVTLWFGVAAALLCVACLGAGLRLYLEDRWAVGGYALGVVGSIVCLSLLRLGGSVLVTDDLASLLWLVGPSVTVAGIAAWPHVPRSASSGKETRP